MKRLVICLVIILATTVTLPGCVPSVQEPVISPTQQTTASHLTLAPTPSPSPEPSPTDEMPLSLAGIVSGERIENIAEKYGLHFVAEKSAEAARINDNYLYAYSHRYATFYDGKGLVVHVFKDGMIGQVAVFTSGYETPDGHQAGEEWPYEQDQIVYFNRINENLSCRVQYIHGNGIRQIIMDVYLDRILSESMADLNDNGIDERFIITGRASTALFEILPENRSTSGAQGEDLLYDDDPATRPRLTVYENDDIIWSQELNYYPYPVGEDFPSLTTMSKEKENSFLELCYPTGGSGGDMYYKVLYDDSKETYATEFWYFGFDWDQPE